jgi:hypothetical protein
LITQAQPSRGGLAKKPAKPTIVNRRIIIHSLPTTELNRFVEVEVYYDEGGMSFLSGGFNKRGYYLAVQPVKREGNCKSMLAFSGTTNCAKSFVTREGVERAAKAYVAPEVGLPWQNG